MFPIVHGYGRRSPAGASGFTVIELVIVMSMMVILVGIDVPPPAVPLAMLDLKPLAVPGAEAF